MLAASLSVKATLKPFVTNALSDTPHPYRVIAASPTTAITRILFPYFIIKCPLYMHKATSLLTWFVNFYLFIITPVSCSIAPLNNLYIIQTKSVPNPNNNDITTPTIIIVFILYLRYKSIGDLPVCTVFAS